MNTRRITRSTVNLTNLFEARSIKVLHFQTLVTITVITQSTGQTTISITRKKVSARQDLITIPLEEKNTTRIKVERRREITIRTMRDTRTVPVMRISIRTMKRIRRRVKKIITTKTITTPRMRTTELLVMFFFCRLYATKSSTVQNYLK